MKNSANDEINIVDWWMAFKQFVLVKKFFFVLHLFFLTFLVCFFFFFYLCTEKPVCKRTLYCKKMRFYGTSKKDKSDAI